MSTHTLIAPWAVNLSALERLHWEKRLHVPHATHSAVRVLGRGDVDA